MPNSYTRKIYFYNLKNIITDISKNSKNKFSHYFQQYIHYWIEENINNPKLKKRIIYMVSEYCPNYNLINFIKKIKSCEINEK